MVIRKMTLEEIRHHRFSEIEVLRTPAERRERHHKLESAMALTNGQHEPVWIHVGLIDGQVVEIYSSLIDLEDEYVEIRGGLGIPLKAIYDVGV